MANVLAVAVKAIAAFTKGSTTIEGTLCVTYIQLGRGPASVFQTSVKYGDCPETK